MWASNERRISQQKCPAEHKSRRFQIEDRLKKGLPNSPEQCRHLGSKHVGSRPDVSNDLIPNQWRRYRDAVTAAGFIGAQ
jgi:hypothetical protein